MRRAYDVLDAKQLLVPQVLTADVGNGTAADLGAHRPKRHAMIVVETGAVVASGQLTLPYEGSDDNVSWTAVGSVVANAASTRYRLSVAPYRYYRQAASSTFSGTSIAVAASVIAFSAAPPVTS